MGSKSAKTGGASKLRIAAVGEDRRDIRALLAQLEPVAKVVKEKKAETGDLVAMSLTSYRALCQVAEAAAAGLASQDGRAAKRASSSARADSPAAAPKEATATASVRVWRERRGMTQDELVRKIGLSKSFLSEIENGKKTGSVKTLRAIADALGIDLTQLAF